MKKKQVKRILKKMYAHTPGGFIDRVVDIQSGADYYIDKIAVIYCKDLIDKYMTPVPVEKAVLMTTWQLGMSLKENRIDARSELAKDKRFRKAFEIAEKIHGDYVFCSADGDEVYVKEGEYEHVYLYEHGKNYFVKDFEKDKRTISVELRYSDVANKLGGVENVDKEVLTKAINEVATNRRLESDRSDLVYIISGKFIPVKFDWQ